MTGKYESLAANAQGLWRTNINTDAARKFVSDNMSLSGIDGKSEKQTRYAESVRLDALFDLLCKLDECYGRMKSIERKISKGREVSEASVQRCNNQIVNTEAKIETLSKCTAASEILDHYA